MIFISELLYIRTLSLPHILSAQSSSMYCTKKINGTTEPYSPHPINHHVLSINTLKSLFMWFLLSMPLLMPYLITFVLN